MMKSIIANSPHRLEIERDILAGVPTRDIAQKYGIKSNSVVHQYAKKKMPELISKAELQTVEGLIDRISKYMSTVEALIASITEWLEDPSGRLSIDASPRASEITVMYMVRQGDKIIRRKATLQELLDEIYNESNKTVDKLYLNCQDPRITLLKAVDTLNRQLELLAKAKVIATDHISVDIKTTLAVPELVKLIREALIEYPEALESVISKLSDFIQGEEQAV